jgi:hypothetical protein
MTATTTTATTGTTAALAAAPPREKHTTGSSYRTLPLLVAPLPGEPFDSWLLTYAHRLGVPVGDLLSALGLLSGTVTVEHTVLLHPDEATRTARLTGLSTAQLHAMTLRIFDGHLVTLAASRRAVTRSVWWARGSGSRFCPQCLTERDGRWLLRWRLSWVFACTRHHSLLHDRCPHCTGIPRHRKLSIGWDQAPAFCTGMPSRPCGTDLRTAPPRPLADDDPILAAQQWIDHLVDAVEHGHGNELDVSAAQRCTDLRGVGGWLLRQGQAADFDEFGSSVVREWHAAQARYRQHDIRPSQFPPTDAALMGALTTRALRLITAGDQGRDQQAVTEIQRLLLRSPKRPHVCPPGLSPQWRRLTPATRNLFLRAGDPDRSYIDRLRHRSCCPTARLPELDGATTRVRAAHVPQLLWPSWTIRLLPAQGLHTDPFRATMALNLLIPGDGRRPVSHTATHLHPYIKGTLVSSALLHLAKHGHHTVFPALCELADNLDQHGSPIDYTRRRRVITPEILTDQDWSRICHTTRTHPGIGRRFVDARRYLMQRLTGCDFNDPANPLTFASPQDRSLFTDFVVTMTTNVREALNQHAAEQLHALGIDEPVQWEPPRDWAPSLVPPGREPDDIDIDKLRCLVIDRGVKVSDAATRLATHVEHVRLALETIERVDTGARPGTARVAEAQDRRAHARTILTPQFFQREYIQNGRSLTQIARSTGISRPIVVEIAKEAGHVLTPGVRRIVIDEQWLREQYLDKRRSFPDIGKECGASEATVTRCAREYGIPARPAGIASHPDVIAKTDSALHPDIRRALAGLHGWQRLHRFRAAMAFPSIRAAADELGINQATLIHQLQRLEADIGAPLYTRATPAQPLRVTRRGAAVLRALDRPEAQRHLAVAATAGTAANGQLPRKAPPKPVVKYVGNTRKPSS